MEKQMAGTLFIDVILSWNYIVIDYYYINRLSFTNMLFIDFLNQVSPWELYWIIKVFFALKVLY